MAFLEGHRWYILVLCVLYRNYYNIVLVYLFLSLYIFFFSSNTRRIYYLFFFIFSILARIIHIFLETRRPYITRGTYGARAIHGNRLGILVM